MAGAYTVTGTSGLAQLDETPGRRVLVTGAAGRIGSYFAEHSHEKYVLRLMVQRPEEAEQVSAYGEVVVGDLTDLATMKAFCRDIDTVVHLAADPSPSATWQSVLPNNIIGSYNTFVGAKAAGCRRMIFASSVHAVTGHPEGRQVHTSDPVNPGDIYGVSKCFGEALGRYMAEQEGLSVMVIRIGGFQPLDTARHPTKLNLMDVFVSQRDLTQLIHRCIDVQGLQFAIFHGLSNNRYNRLDISDARELLGYEPQDDFAAEHPLLKDLDFHKRVLSHDMVDVIQRSGLRKDL
jgi:nucleoside-diphosphate-sugar epimerase